MDAQKLRVFLAAVKAGSFLRAADSLGYTPSGITHMMDALEKSIGFKLLSRGRFGVKLTEDGRRLLPLFENYVALDDQIQEEIDSMRSNMDGYIHLGAYASIARSWIPVFIREFKDLAPNITLDIKVGSMDEIYQWLYDGTVDIGFVSKNEKFPCDFIPLWEDRHYAVFPPTVSLESLESFPTEDLERFSFIMPSFGRNLDVQSVLDAAGIVPSQYVAEADDQTILSMVANGLGVSIFSELVLDGNVENIQAVPLSPPSDIPRSPHPRQRH